MAAGVTEIGTDTGSSVFTFTVTSNVNVGDVVVVPVITEQIITFANHVSDSKSNTWTLVQDAFFAASAKEILIHYSVITTPLVSGTDSITWSPPGNASSGIQGIRVTGLTASPSDAANNGNGNQSTSTPTTGASGTLAQADELVIAVYGMNASGAGTPSFTPPTGFSQTGLTAAIFHGAVQMCSCYQEVSSTASVNPQATLGASALVGGVVTPFEVAAVTGTKPFNPIPFIRAPTLEGGGF